MFAGATQATRVFVAVLTAVLTVLGYFAYRLITHRRFYKDLPKPPHSLFWGHLKLFGIHQATFPKHTNISPVLAEIKREYGLGDIFYLDLWPLGPCFLVLTAPDAVAIPSTVQAAPQSQVVISFYSSTVGPGFIDGTNGALWKHLHRLIAPAVTPSATRNYLPVIINEAAALHARLKAFSDCEETIDLGYEVGKFPFAIILRVLLGDSLDGLVSGELYNDASAFALAVGEAAYRSPSPLHAWWLRRTKVKHLKARIESTFEGIIDRKYAELVQQKDRGLVDNNISLPIMDRMIQDSLLHGRPLDQGLRRLIIENGNGLIAAGAGTTTDALCYIFMMLSTHPESLQKVRQEHDRLFGPTFDSTMASLEENPVRIKQLEFTTAVIQETLRLFSVGFPIRDPPPGMSAIEYRGKSYPVKNQTFGLDMHDMHYDESLFPEAKRFKPERFLGNASDINRNAYRPFERGLRACPGQALAIDEMRVAVLMTARWFDFKLVDHEPSEVPRVSYTDMDLRIGKHAFQHSNFTPGPPGKVAMRVSSTERG